MEKYDSAVFIGRFQPFHTRHLETALHGLHIAKKLIIVVGSSNAAPSIKNPFSFEERANMILSCFMDPKFGDILKRIHIVPVRDYFHSDNTWLAEIQQKTSQIISPNQSVALLGSYKDDSSYYLKMFPQWEFVPVKEFVSVDATEIRNSMYEETHLKSHAWVDKNPGFRNWPNLVPPSIATWLTDNFMGTPRFETLKEEYAHIVQYKKLWESAPFPPTFNTTDAVVIQSGHVLLVKRKFSPGKGLLALPGGFIKANERIEDACLRELKEETGIRVAQPILRSSIKENKVFDYPGRSLRGRTITHAFYMKLADGELPEVKGTDDAERAFWLPLMDVGKRENEFFEDHCAIISYFMGR